MNIEHRFFLLSGYELQPTEMLEQNYRVLETKITVKGRPVPRGVSSPPYISYTVVFTHYVVVLV